MERYLKMLYEGRDIEFELVQVSKVPLQSDFSALVFNFQFLFRKLLIKSPSAKQYIPSTMLLKTQRYTTPRFSLLYSER